MTSKDPDDQLRDELFAAARLDRASDAARARALAGVLAATTVTAPVESVEGRVDREEPTDRIRVALAPRAARGVSIALGLAAAVVAFVLLRHEPRKALELSPAAETVSGGAARTNPPEPAPSLTVTASPSSNDVPQKGSSIPPRAARQNAGRERDAGARVHFTPPSLDDEVTALEHARTALGSGDAKRALELLASYQNVLHGTRLTAEATLLKIEALAKSGRTQAAADLARRFIEANRGNPLVDRARRFAETPPDPSSPEVPKIGDVP